MKHNETNAIGLPQHWHRMEQNETNAIGLPQHWHRMEQNETNAIGLPQHWTFARDALMPCVLLLSHNELELIHIPPSTLDRGGGAWTVRGSMLGLNLGTCMLGKGGMFE